MSLDGIGMKISDSFVPSAKITLPIGFDIGNPSEVLFLDYDFSLEEKVVKWSDQQKEIERERLEKIEKEKEADELKKRQEEERERKEKEEEEERRLKQTETENREHESDLSEREQSAQAQANDSTANTSGYGTGSGVPSATTVGVNNVGSGILLPTAAPSTVKSDEPQTQFKKSTSFNLADFEKVQDPFDDLELKTLDDRSELHQMLSAVQPTIPSTQPQNVQYSTNLPAGTTGNLQNQNEQQSQMPPPTITTGSVGVPTVNSLVSSIKDVEYPDIDYAEDDSNPAPICTVSQSTGSVDATSVRNSFMFNPSSVPSDNTNTFSGFLPPITSSVPVNYSQISTAQAPAGSIVGYPAALTQPCINIHNQHSVSYSTNPGQSTAQAMASHAQRIQNINHGIRSVRSNPDISTASPVPHTFHNASQTPPPSLPANRQSAKSIHTESRPQSQQQSWNRYPVIPPTRPGTASSRSSSPGGSAVGNGVGVCGGGSNVLNMNGVTGAARVSPTPSCLTDPYDRLQPEMQRFIDNITNMGFTRARVSRAVEKLGQNDKKVLDFMCLLNKLTSQGYSGDVVEDALHIFNYNEKKVTTFLTLYTQFEGLGFESQNVREALLQTSLDQDRTLDILTAA